MAGGEVEFARLRVDLAGTARAVMFSQGMLVAAMLLLAIPVLLALYWVLGRPARDDMAAPARAGAAAARQAMLPGLLALALFAMGLALPAARLLL